jgi:N-acetylglucosaminyldiphosphoundecaprenol N-acetyl-beta-D-mannosaminyltransferase
MKVKKTKKILGIRIFTQKKENTLEKIKKYLENATDFCHIVSLNPENLVVAKENKEFKKVIETAQIQIVDGVGVVLASRLLGVSVGQRYPGVDLVDDLLNLSSKMRLRVLLIGAKSNLAESLADCYQKKYPEAKFFGLEGISDIKNPKKEEEEKIFSIISDYKPHLVLVAFGSPDQELWIERHKKEFKNCVVMGVGGAFDFLGGTVPRAPLFLRRLGLEWLFRLLIQPWRLRRQLRLLKFLWLIFWELLDRLLNKILFFSLKKSKKI